MTSSALAQQLQPARVFGRFTRWLTGKKHALYSFSMLRILYGLGLLSVLVPSFADRSYLWGPASWWVNPEAKRRGFITFDVLFSKSSPFWFDVAFLAFVLLTVVFILGYRTRVVTPLLLIAVVSLQSNNSYLLNGGDVLMRITLSFMVFADLSAHFSLDARRKKRILAQGKQWQLVPAPLSHAAHNAALILCAFQIMLVYVTSAVYKLMGSEWLDGTAFYYALTLDAFQVHPLVNELIWQSSLAIMIATWISVVVQLLFPVMLLWRPSRVFALISMMLMHLGIALLLSLWAFSLVMIALDLLFVRDRTWVWMGNGLASVRRQVVNTLRSAKGAGIRDTPMN